MSHIGIGNHPYQQKKIGLNDNYIILCIRLKISKKLFEFLW